MEPTKLLPQRQAATSSRQVARTRSDRETVFAEVFAMTAYSSTWLALVNTGYTAGIWRRPTRTLISA